ncbi:unnamed protein product [Withania somnifera]
MASLWRAVMGDTTPSNNDGVEFWRIYKNMASPLVSIETRQIFWFKQVNITRGSTPRGIVPVSNCLTVKGADDVLNKQFAFEISSRSGTMYFIADSEKEKEDWINSIGRSIVKHSRSVTRDEILDY